MLANAAPCTTAPHRHQLLWGGPARRQERAEEVVISGILNAIAVQILPPSPTQVSRLPGPEFRLSCAEELKRPVHWQRILHDEGIVVEPLACDEDHAGRAAAESGRRRGRG